MKLKNLFLFICITLLYPVFIWSQSSTSVVSQSDGFEVIRPILLFIGILLFIVIIILGNTLSASYKNFIKNKLHSIVPWAAILLFSFSILSPHKISAQGSINIGKLSQIPFDIWVYVVILLLEIIVVIFLSNKIRSLIIIEPKVKIENKDSWLVRLFYKLNNFRPIEEESSFDVGHNYDGIRELDNKTPAWWNWSFLFSFVFAILYMYRYHIAHSAPLPLEELKIAQTEAAIKKAEYLKNAAEMVDETNVSMSDEAGIAIGSALFAKNCVVCHGAKGEGGIGPNMTDDYWIHKGSIKDIFYSVKYGWPQNGMKGWVEDFSPSEIAHVSSYVKTLLGTNPPNQKEKQGELYKDLGPTPDSSVISIDTTAK